MQYKLIKDFDFSRSFQSSPFNLGLILTRTLPNKNPDILGFINVYTSGGNMLYAGRSTHLYTVSSNRQTATLQIIIVLSNTMTGRP
jgi:hypothetical protein